MINGADDVASQRLLDLGSSSYYDNQIETAVEFFERAVEAAQSPKLRVSATTWLAAAMSKAGRPDEALEVIGQVDHESEEAKGATFFHRRSVILAELGRLAEAVSDMTAALEHLDKDDDPILRSGVLVNLGAATSEMGQLETAGLWFRQALALAEANGQQREVAIIEGNLGFLESRRGNFAQALTWYDKGRSSFGKLGEAGLLLAVLEVDHARTLIDMGLTSEAIDVADLASSAAASGGNQMLETQAILLAAEARLRSGDIRDGSLLLAAGADRARGLTLETLGLWADYLAETLGSDHELDGEGDDDIDRFVEAGWIWEAHACVLERARKHLRSDPDRAKQLLDQVDKWDSLSDLDPAAKMVGELLKADLANDPDTATESLRQGLNLTAQQQALVGSAELWWSLDSRVISLQNNALSEAIRRPDPALQVLRVLEWTREVCYTRVRPNSSASWSDDKVKQARAARVAVAEARFSGGDVREASKRLLAVEREVLRSRRTEAGSGQLAVSDVADIAMPTLPEGVVGITYVAIEGTLYGLRQLGSDTRLVDLGPPEPITANLRAQRTRLRRLGDERRSNTAQSLAALGRINDELDRLVIQPLEIPTNLSAVVAPTIRLRDVAWGALPSLVDRPVVVTSSFSRWLKAPDRLSIASTALVEGPDLGASERELQAIAERWNETHIVRGATCDQAIDTLGRHHLVHVCAHGTLRPDNAFFSAIEFADGPLTLLELVSLPKLPEFLILASCDAAAGVDAGRDAAVSTVNELRNHGVQVVIAPLVAVNDRAAADYSTLLHRYLADGASIDESALAVRRELLATGDPRHQATAMAFTVFGGRCTAQPVR